MVWHAFTISNSRAITTCMASYLFLPRLGISNIHSPANKYPYPSPPVRSPCCTGEPNILDLASAFFKTSFYQYHRIMTMSQDPPRQTVHTGAHQKISVPFAPRTRRTTSTSNADSSNPLTALSSVAPNLAPEHNPDSNEHPRFPLTIPYIATCGHVYCYYCVADWILRIADEGDEEIPGWECSRCTRVVKDVRGWRWRLKGAVWGSSIAASSILVKCRAWLRATANL